MDTKTLIDALRDTAGTCSSSTSLGDALRRLADKLDQQPRRPAEPAGPGHKPYCTKDRCYCGSQ
jgi:hypothetical protein